MTAAQTKVNPRSTHGKTGARQPQLEAPRLELLNLVAQTFAEAVSREEMADSSTANPSQPTFYKE
jgi:DNA-binding winged helix-turn-helix (wHTH) protein